MQTLFFILGGVALVSGGLVVFQKHPLRSALWLIVNFFAVAGIYLLAHAEFIAAIQAIVANEAEDHGKYPVAFTIDLQRCIFCGFCQEACPKGAIKLNSLYELAQYDKKLLILDIEGATQSKSQLRLGDWL